MVIDTFNSRFLRGVRTPLDSRKKDLCYATKESLIFWAKANSIKTREKMLCSFCSSVSLKSYCCSMKTFKLGVNIKRNTKFYDSWFHPLA